MSMTILEIKNHLIGMGHGGTLKKIRNQMELFRRAANNVVSKIDVIDTERTVPLSNTVHDTLNDYALPSDYKKAIDLFPDGQRGHLDSAKRQYPERFDLRKALDNKTITIEGDNGAKHLRINWKTRSPKVLNAADSLTGNGLWSVVGTATNLVLDTIYKYSGGASLRFDVVANNDGIQNTTMTQVDLTDENRIADNLVAVYLPTTTGLTSITPVWGNDLTTKYWSGATQTTQADGTAFKIGWNILRIAWSGATQTGVVVPAQIDSYKLTFQVSAPIANIRVDNILFSIGRPFDLKYYSKYLFQSAAGVWMAQPTDDSDVIVIGDPTGENIFLYECLVEMAQQMEGTDSDFDLVYASRKLYGNPDAGDAVEKKGLYAKYRTEYPSAAKKAVTGYNGTPRFRR